MKSIKQSASYCSHMDGLLWWVKWCPSKLQTVSYLPKGPQRISGEIRSILIYLTELQSGMAPTVTDKGKQPNFIYYCRDRDFIEINRKPWLKNSRSWKEIFHCSQKNLLLKIECWKKRMLIFLKSSWEIAAVFFSYDIQ